MGGRLRNPHVIKAVSDVDTHPRNASMLTAMWALVSSLITTEDVLTRIGQNLINNVCACASK